MDRARPCGGAGGIGTSAVPVLVATTDKPNRRTRNARTGKEQRTASMFPLPLAGVEAEIFPEPRARREDGAQVGNRRQQGCDALS